jgi:hypothetical protein
VFLRSWQRSWNLLGVNSLGRQASLSALSRLETCGQRLHVSVIKRDTVLALLHSVCRLDCTGKVGTQRRLVRKEERLVFPERWYLHMRCCQESGVLNWVVYNAFELLLWCRSNNGAARRTVRSG